VGTLLSRRGRLATAGAHLWGRVQGPAGNLEAGYRPVLFTILAAAFLLRLATAWQLPNIHHADEVFQVAEQANRSVNGYGIVSWEFQTASRGALLPSIVTPFFLVDAPPAVQQMLIAALFSALSLIPVWVAFHWAGRLYGTAGGALAAVMVATWVEAVYFAPKPTPDAVSGYFLLAALFLARPGAERRDLFLAGISFMLALTIRMQIAPAVGVALLLTAADKHERTQMAPLVAGAAAAVVLVGTIEWLWWGAPFRGHWNYLVMEFAHGASDFFGRQPLTFYAKNYVLMYGGLLPVIAFLVYAGARRAPILLLTAVAVIVPFHFIGHKEYRFLVPSVPLLVLLMGLGAADLLMRVAGAVHVRTATLVVCGWLVAGIAISCGDYYRPYWFLDRNHILAFRAIGAQPDACGVALVGIRWWHTPGQSGLGRDIPLYESGRDERAMAALAPAANYVLAGPKSPAPPAPYVQWQEYSRPVEFLYRRPGRCVPDEPARVRPAPPMDRIE
jgi:phosphatidylinositol glycan class B